MKAKVIYFGFFYTPITRVEFYFCRFTAFFIKHFGILPYQVIIGKYEREEAIPSIDALKKLQMP